MRSTRNKIGIAVCVVASLMALCCKNSSDAQTVNDDAKTVSENERFVSRFKGIEHITDSLLRAGLQIGNAAQSLNEDTLPVRRKERLVPIETIKDSLLRAGLRIGNGVSIDDYETFVQEERMRRFVSKYKCSDDFKSRHRDNVFGGLANDDHHVPDSGYMYDTALGRMMTEYFEKHYGKITASGTSSGGDKISYFPMIFNPYDNEWMSDLVTDSLDYDIRCDTIISWNHNLDYGLLFSRKDAIAYRKSVRIVKLDGKWQSPHCFNVWDGKEDAAPARIPAIYYWDTIAINNTEEVD